MQGDAGQESSGSSRAAMHDRELEVGDAVDHEREPAQRRRVEPVGVVDDQHRRAAVGDVPVELVEVARAAEQLLDAAERQPGLELAAGRGEDRRAAVRARASSAVLPIPAGPRTSAHPPRSSTVAQRGDLGFALEQKSQGRSPGGRAPGHGRSCSG